VVRGWALLPPSLGTLLSFRVEIEELLRGSAFVVAAGAFDAGAAYFDEVDGRLEGSGSLGFGSGFTSSFFVGGGALDASTFTG
jgi:hypothetical protein